MFFLKYAHHKSPFYFYSKQHGCFLDPISRLKNGEGSPKPPLQKALLFDKLYFRACTCRCFTKVTISSFLCFKKRVFYRVFFRVLSKFLLFYLLLVSTKMEICSAYFRRQQICKSPFENTTLPLSSLKQEKAHCIDSKRAFYVFIPNFAHVQKGVKMVKHHQKSNNFTFCVILCHFWVSRWGQENTHAVSSKKRRAICGGRIFEKH